MADDGMSEEERVAYEAARRYIKRKVYGVRRNLKFDRETYRALTRIPDQIARLQGLTQLDLDNTRSTDLTPLSGLRGLQELRLNRTGVTDLTPLRGLTGLEALYLNETGVTDLTPLHALARLRILSLNQTGITDLSPIRDLTGLGLLFLDRTGVTDLTPIGGRGALSFLSLTQTGVTDLTPIRDLKGLRYLQLDLTGVTDLTPLRELKGLERLSLGQTGVTDLRPLIGLEKLGEGGIGGLWFDDTPAVRLDKTLARLAQIEDDQQRAKDTLAYLKTLPPWPEPLPWLQTKAPEPVLTVEAVLKSQSPLGWRFSPFHGAMVVYVEDSPLTARQDSLGKLSRQRSDILKATLKGANSGLRGQAADEVDRFTGILADDARSLSLRALELWGSLIALGGILDGNDIGQRQGRDPLDLLTIEQRSALQTLLQIAGNLVRSFPDVQAMDDGAAGFLRREVTLETVAAMIEAALRAAFVSADSAALMQHVAKVGHVEGSQGDKATSVSARGVGNLIRTAALFVRNKGAKIAGAVVTGAATGVGIQVGGEIADHYNLGQAAVAYIEEVRTIVDPLLDNLPPDEAAELRAAIRDAESVIHNEEPGPQ